MKKEIYISSQEDTLVANSVYSHKGAIPYAILMTHNVRSSSAYDTEILKQTLRKKKNISNFVVIIIVGGLEYMVEICSNVYRLINSLMTFIKHNSL